LTLRVAGKRDDTVRRKIRGARLRLADEQRQQARQVWKMSNQQHVPGFADQPIADPVGRIAGLQVFSRRKLRQRIASPPESFGRLFRTELSTVPDYVRTNPAAGGFRREKINRRPADRRQWTLRVDFGTYRIAVMNEIETHQMNDSPRQPRGVGGWLLLLVVLLLVWRPVNAAVVASNALSALSVRGPSLPLALIALTIVTSFGVAAGIALATRRGPAVMMAQAALLLSAAMDLVVYLSPYFPSNRMPTDVPVYVGVSMLGHGLWLAYLARSRRVQNSY
jgi:hypothetical protein